MDIRRARQLALQPAVVRRGLTYSVVVGSVLIAINHGDALLKGDVDKARIAKMVLTAVVPYLVSTFSSVGAMLGAATPQAGDPTSRRSE